MQNQQFPRFLSAPRVLGAVLLSILLLTQQVQYASAAGTGGVPVLRTFEDLPAGKAVFNDYDGVTFPQGSADFHPITIFKPSVATASPSQALQAQLRTAEFTGTQLIMHFDVPQSRVSLSTGLAPLFAGTMLLQGFSSDPTTSNSGLIAQSLAPCLGTGPTPILTPLEIDDQSARILYAQLSLVSCSAPTDPTSGLSNGTIVLDNLLYNRSLHPPAREHNPPIITITSPTNGLTVQGTTPGSISTVLLATVKETAIMSMTAQVNGHAAVPMNYWNTSPGNFDAGLTLNDSVGLIEGINTVVLKVVDFDLPPPPNTGTASVTFTFKKLPPPSSSQVDIMPTAYEVTQTIDYGPRNDWDPTVNGYAARVVPFPFDPPLMQGKPTLVRIYAAASGTNTPQQNVPATAFVLRDNCTNNCGIPGAEGILAPMSGWTAPYPKGVPIPNISGITIPPLGTPDSVPSNATPELRKTWDFLLPADWTQSNLVVHVTINSGNYSNLPHGTSVPECTSNTAGTCNHNNEVELHLRFITAPTIFVNYVMIHVTGSYNGQNYNDVQPSMDQVTTIFARLNELYPEHVMIGSREDITVSPDINKDDLLDKVGQCPKLLEACAAAPLILGVFPSDKSLPQGGLFPISKDVSGYGKMGGWGAWANANNPDAAAHELAHNIGFDHWGCGHGPEQGDECGVFPIPHGGTDVFGTDIVNWSVIAPGDTSNPDNNKHAHDFMTSQQQMSQWVSWYTYEILLDHSMPASYDTNDPPAFLLSGRISPSGIATFRPIYVINASQPVSDTINEDDPNSIYTMQGFDSKGNILFVHNFEPFKYDTHRAGPSNLGFEEAVPVVPDLQRIEVLKGATVLGTLMNPAPGAGPSVTISDPTSGSVWQVGKRQTIRWSSTSPAGVPLFAMVEYSPDGGKTRILLGRDLTSTSLTINPDELPGSTNAMIYVQVSDGMNIATAAAGPFTVQPKPPNVHIITPTTNSQGTAFVPLTLTGTAYDRQESLTDAQFKWSSDRDGVLGNGQLLTVSKLSVGHHTLTLTVTDSHGRVGRDTVQIDVVAFGTSQSPPSFNWLIFWAIAIALLLLVLVLAFIIVRRRQTAGGQR